MKLNTQTHDSMSGGVLQSTKMSIILDAQAFRNYFSGIYADKILAPVRETTTNARDGHAAAGKLDVPFQVHIPSAFDSTFWVRDFGCSMSHEFMMTGYTQINNSTKRDDNNAVGALGMGRISPLAYVNSYTVTCWIDGKENVYSVFIGGDGIPDVSLLNSRPSSEPTGVRVSFPTKQEDRYKFENAVRAVRFGFPVPFKVVNETFEDEVPAPYLAGTNWVIYDDSNWPLPNNGVYARQGCVLYPISSAFIRNHFYNYSHDLKQLKMIINFPIGELSVSISREELGYDDPTVENLTKGITDAVKEIGEAMSTHIQSLPDFWTACLDYQSVLNSHYSSSKRAIRSIASQNMSWQCLPLAVNFPLEMLEQDTRGTLISKSHDRFGKQNYTLGFRQRSVDQSLTLHEMQNLTVYVEYEDCKFGTARMRQVLSEIPQNDDRYILWMRPSSQVAVNIWRKSHGNMEVIDLATIEPMKLARTPGVKKAADQVRCRYFVAGKSSHHQKLAEYEEVTLDKDMFFIIQDAGGYVLKANRSYGQDVLIANLNELVEAGILAHGTRVYVVNQTNEKRVTAFFKGKIPAIEEKILGLFETKFTVSTLKLLESNYAFQQNNTRARSLNDIIPLLNKPLADIQAFVTTYLGGNAVTQFDSSARTALKSWAPQVFVKTADDVHVTAWNDLCDTYPLLEMTLRYSYGKAETESRLTHYLNLEASKGN